MIVEDDSSIAQTMVLALRLIPNVEVDRAYNGEEALRLWTEKPADVLLTDYHMREMTGMELVRHLRANNYTQPMIMITAYDSVELQREAREAGVTQVIGKPFFIDQLIDRVSELLGQSKVIGS
jgi:CheY-like chemotaxis protein